MMFIKDHGKLHLSIMNIILQKSRDKMKLYKLKEANQKSRMKSQNITQNISRTKGLREQLFLIGDQISRQDFLI